MASFLSNLFGGGNKINMAYNGLKPVTSQSQVQGGPDYYNQILARSQGQGVGYGSDYTSYANPQISNLRENFQDYQLPELKSYLSATGRTGSPGSTAVQQAAKEEGLSENSIMGQLMQRNAERSNADINNAISEKGAYVGNEANLANNAANFDMGLSNRDVAYQEGKNARDIAGAKNLAGTAGSILSSFPMPSFGGADASGAYPTGQTMNYGGKNYPITTNPNYTQQVMARTSRGQRGGY